MGAKNLKILTIFIEILIICSLSVKCDEYKCPEGILDILKFSKILKIVEIPNFNSRK